MGRSAGYSVRSVNRTLNEATEHSAANSLRFQLASARSENVRVAESGQESRDVVPTTPRIGAKTTRVDTACGTLIREPGEIPSASELSIHLRKTTHPREATTKRMMAAANSALSPF